MMKTFVYLNKSNNEIVFLRLGYAGYKEIKGGVFNIKNNELLYYATLNNDHYVLGIVDVLSDQNLSNDFYNQAEEKIVSALNETSKQDNLNFNFYTLSSLTV